MPPSARPLLHLEIGRFAALRAVTNFGFLLNRILRPGGRDGSAHEGAALRDGIGSKSSSTLARDLLFQRRSAASSWECRPPRARAAADQPRCVALRPDRTPRARFRRRLHRGAALSDRVIAMKLKTLVSN